MVDIGHSAYKILGIISVTFHYMTNNPKFLVIYNDKYLFLIQVHIVSYWLDVVILLQTAGQTSSTYLLILEPKLEKKALCTTCFPDGREHRAGRLL